MAQHDFVINNAGFPAVRSDINDFLNAVRTTHSGTSTPSGAVAGTIWLDTTSATTPTLKYYDGTDNISLATIDHVGNTVNWLDSTVSITGISTTATGTVLTLTDTANTTSVNLIIDNQKEIRFRETTANGTNYVALKAPASLSADATFTLPATDGTNGQALITNGSGVLSFSTISTSLATPLAVVGDATAGAEIRLPEDTDNGANYVALKAPNTIASNLTLTLPSADGTSGQVLQTNGSGVLSFSSPSSDFVLLATTDASSVASVSFDGYFSATYSHYRIMLRNVVPATSGVKLYMRFRESNADVTSSDYRYVCNTMYGDGSNFNEGNVAGVFGDSVFFITGRGGDNIGNSVSQGGMGGEIRLIGDPLDTSAIKQIDSYTKGNASLGHTQNHRTNGYLNRTPAITGFTLYYSSGNIASGRIQLYGIK